MERQIALDGDVENIGISIRREVTKLIQTDRSEESRTNEKRKGYKKVNVHLGRFEPNIWTWVCEAIPAGNQSKIETGKWDIKYQMKSNK